MEESFDIKEIFDSFQDQPILVLGDVMVDSYYFGEVNRISPEAPIPIVDVTKKENRLGGAANVALNIRELGGIPILASVIGDDAAGHELLQVLHQHQIYSSGIILNSDRTTTLKSRIFSQNRQMMRYDEEVTDPLDSNLELLFIDKVVELIQENEPKAIVFQDYDKGVLTPRIIANILRVAEQLSIPTAVDPKWANFFEYKNCTLFKPNLREIREAFDFVVDAEDTDSLIHASHQLRKHLNNEIGVITLSDRGIFINTGDDMELIPAYNKKVFDVSGAGDTVISVLTLGLALGLDMIAMTELANIAAALVCQKVGVASVSSKELMTEASKLLS